MNPPMWNTQNDIAHKVRADAIELLNQPLLWRVEAHIQAKE